MPNSFRFRPDLPFSAPHGNTFIRPQPPPKFAENGVTGANSPNCRKSLFARTLHGRFSPPALLANLTEKYADELPICETDMPHLRTTAPAKKPAAADELPRMPRRVFCRIPQCTILHRQMPKEMRARQNTNADNWREFGWMIYRRRGGKRRTAQHGAPDFRRAPANAPDSCKCRKTPRIPNAAPRIPNANARFAARRCSAISSGRRRFFCNRAHGKAAERRRQDHGRRAIARKTIPTDFVARLAACERMQRAARAINNLPRMHRDFCRADIQTPPPEVLHGIAERPPLQIAALVNAARNALLHGRKNAARMPRDEFCRRAGRHFSPCCTPPCCSGNCLRQFRPPRDDFPPCERREFACENSAAAAAQPLFFRA